MQCCKFRANAKSPSENYPKMYNEIFCRTCARWLFVAKEQLPVSGHRSIHHVCGAERCNREQRVALAVYIGSRWLFNCHCRYLTSAFETDQRAELGLNSLLYRHTLWKVQLSFQSREHHIVSKDARTVPGPGTRHSSYQ
jgi:hypothetical protein